MFLKEIKDKNLRAIRYGIFLFLNQMERNKMLSNDNKNKVENLRQDVLDFSFIEKYPKSEIIDGVKKKIKIEKEVRFKESYICNFDKSSHQELFEKYKDEVFCLFKTGKKFDFFLEQKKIINEELVMNSNLDLIFDLASYYLNTHYKELISLGAEPFTNKFETLLYTSDALEGGQEMTELEFQVLNMFSDILKKEKCYYDIWYVYYLLKNKLCKFKIRFNPMLIDDNKFKILYNKNF